MEITPANQSLRRAALAARQRNRALRASLDRHDLDAAMQIIREQHEPGGIRHYHIVYHVPNEELSIPHFRVGYATNKAALLAMQEMGKASEPRTEWYENGTIGIETAMPGRTGLWWIVLEASGCISTACRPEVIHPELRLVHSNEAPERGPSNDTAPVLHIVVPEGT